jgi:ferredoxin
VKRKIIRIDEDKCTGCGLCIPKCPEGAIQMIDGKARLIGDLFCDGLGGCLGHCPEDAITVEERDAEPYDERKVMENIIRQGPNTIRAHLIHLGEHNESGHLKTALEFLQEKNIGMDPPGDGRQDRLPHTGGCPGSAQIRLAKKEFDASETDHGIPSELTHWPVQLHLISPMTPAYRGADVILAADCAAYAMGDFHRTFLRGR